MKNLKVYEISYASNMFTQKDKRSTIIYSDEELKIGDFIIVEHINYGLFIGVVLRDCTNEYLENDTEIEIKENIDYRFVQEIDLSECMKKINNEKRKAELKIKMQERFKVIDEEKKYQYYASLDSELNELYEEYKEL